MTSQGSAVTRFERSLETGSASLIVPAALELPDPTKIADGVRILLAVVGGGRDLDGPSWRTSYDGISVRFGTTVARRLELQLGEAVVLFSALQALRSGRPDVGAAALEQLLETHQQTDAAMHVGEWLRLREGVVYTTRWGPASARAAAAAAYGR